MENIYAPLSEACAKTLSDKLHDKRRLASQEIEKMVSGFIATKNVRQIQKLLFVLENQFVLSSDSNKKRGGLLAIAAVAIGLGKDSENHIKELVNPILNCLKDGDNKVRYAAIESLYNVVKVSRNSIVPSFPDVFIALSVLVTDPDPAVRNGSELLDRQLKDIMSESSQLFDLDAFVPLLRERIYSKHSSARQFIISWISILNVVPEINFIVYLPEILDGLFQMLEDKEVHRLCETLLNQFLKTIRADPTLGNIPAMTNVLIGHAQASNELIQATAIRWISEFVHLSGSSMLPYTSGILTAILPCLAYENEAKRPSRQCAQVVNKKMFELVSASNDSELDLNSVMEVLRQYLAHSSSSVNTKVAVLQWVHHLFTEIHYEMTDHSVTLFPVLLGVLSDSSDEVVLQGLSVLAEIVKASDRDAETYNLQYRKLLLSLLNLFIEEKSFLDNKGSLIIRQLCVLLNPEKIFRTFAEIITNETSNIKFASTMVRTLNLILLTSWELFELRSALRNIMNPKSASLFECLYRCWSHCPISTLSLCLLTQCYQHVCRLVIYFGTFEITMEFLVEIDKLVQLIESPIFASLRLTLIANRNGNADAYNLTQALFGILMLLPQTEAFHLLKNRLQCVPMDYKIPVNSDSAVENQSGLNFEDLLLHFKEIQALHQFQRDQQRKRNVENAFNDAKLEI